MISDIVRLKFLPWSLYKWEISFAVKRRKMRYTEWFCIEVQRNVNFCRAKVCMITFRRKIILVAPVSKAYWHPNFTPVIYLFFQRLATIRIPQLIHDLVLTKNLGKPIPLLQRVLIFMFAFIVDWEKLKSGIKAVFAPTVSDSQFDNNHHVINK